MTADSSISIYRNSPSPLHIYMQRILRVILEEANGKRLNERIQTLATLLTAGIHCTWIYFQSLQKMALANAMLTDPKYIRNSCHGIRSPSEEIELTKYVSDYGVLVLDVWPISIAVLCGIPTWAIHVSSSREIYNAGSAQIKCEHLQSPSVTSWRVFESRCTSHCCCPGEHIYTIWLIPSMAHHSPCLLVLRSRVLMHSPHEAPTSLVASQIPLHLSSPYALLPVAAAI